MNGTFPSNRYFVEKNNFVPLYEISRSTLSEEILKFCGSYPVLKVTSAKNVKEIEEEGRRQLFGKAITE